MGRERRRRPLTRAEQLKRHREELQLALSEGISLEEARARHASYREHLPRLVAPFEDIAVEVPPAAAATIIGIDEAALPWWQRY